MSFSSTPPDSAITAAPVPRLRVSPSTLFFITASGLLYACITVAATLTLNAYFAQTWDVTTFIRAGQEFLHGTPLDLYAQSRATQTWPYAYPPLHAFVVGVALFVGNAFKIFPDYVWARIPAMLADIGIAITLYAIVRRKSDDATARVAALIWLFNPITFYDTTVQGHFESEWLLFVLLAYFWRENSRNIFLPSIALALAVLFKQVAILFAIPLWASVIASGAKQSPIHSLGIASPRPLAITHWAHLVLSLAIFALVVGIVCLPYLLYSNDFLYMNLTYVENVPVQTQSWIVALLGVTRTASDALTSDFFLLRYQTLVTMLAAVVLAFIAARRGWSLYLTATLIALAFFLTSKKVMGYYYVMLLPFLLAEILPKRRFDLAAIALVATAWIALSPYYAGWVNHSHWWMYAVLGTLNSLFFAWLFFVIASREAAKQSPTSDTEIASHPSTLLRTLAMTLGLFASAAGAALLQPLTPNNGSPIRAPIIAPGMESPAVFAFAALIVLIVIALITIARVTRAETRTMSVAIGIALVFAPLFFAVFALTKESTAIFEIALKALGV